MQNVQQAVTGVMLPSGQIVQAVGAGQTISTFQINSQGQLVQGPLLPAGNVATGVRPAATAPLPAAATPSVQTIHIPGFGNVQAVQGIQAINLSSQTQLVNGAVVQTLAGQPPGSQTVTVGGSQASPQQVHRTSYHYTVL